MLQSLLVPAFAPKCYTDTGHSIAETATLRHATSPPTRCAAARTPHEQSVLAAQIAATDRQIDRLADELYGLSVEAIRIVEGG